MKILSDTASLPIQEHKFSPQAAEMKPKELSAVKFNTQKVFLYADTLQSSFARDWLRFASKELLEKEIKTDRRLKEDLALFKEGKKPLLDLNESVKELVMLSGNYRVMEIDEDGGFSIRLSYPQLAEILLSDRKIKTKTGYSHKHLIDRFFIERWAEGKLLYPLFMNSKKRFQRKLDYGKFLQEYNIPLVRTLFDYAQSYDKMNLFKSAFYILLSTNWRFVSHVNNKDILELEELIENSEVNGTQKKWYKSSLHFIVYALLEHGRSDLKVPYEYKKSIFPKTDSYFQKVDELIEKCPNYYPLRKDFVDYIAYLDNRERLAESTINVKKTHLRFFMDYLMDRKCGCQLAQTVFDKMFDFSDKDSVFNYFSEKKGRTVISALNDIAVFLGYAGYLSPYIKKMLPKHKSRIKETPRIPFSKEMIKDLIDILLNRPPHEPTKWDRNKADSSWWRHSVYPVLPMMILLHFYIPVRGSQIRNLCRKSSFLINERGKIEKIVINTDKNRNREYLQEIPFVFNGLEIFNDFLKWHKQYYPKIPLYEYDKNAPFAKIEPLFIQPKSLKPVDKSVHLVYLKRLFAQYRIELSDRGGENIHFISLTSEGKKKLGKEFFESVEELNGATNEFIDKHVKMIYDIHTFRVTGTTRYLESGLPINIVMMLTGHTNPNILLNVYHKLTQEEKKMLLRSAEKKIMFDDPASLTDNTEELIRKEILPHYDEKNPDGLKKILDKNGLFTQTRKKSSASNAKVNAIEDIAKIPPLQWLPMVGGICPGVTCPDGREKKCSLCPYFITGIYFIDGIVFRANSAVLSFHRKLEEFKLDKKSRKTEDLELLMEEIYGWFEILNRIQNGKEKKDSENFPAKRKDFIGTANVSDTLAYLENCYQAEMLGTAPDLYGIKVLTIKAVKLAMKNGDAEISEIIGSDRKAIDYIMNGYQKAKQSPRLLTEFLRSLGEEVPLID